MQGVPWGKLEECASGRVFHRSVRVRTKAKPVHNFLFFRRFSCKQAISFNFASTLPKDCSLDLDFDRCEISIFKLLKANTLAKF